MEELRIFMMTSHARSLVVGAKFNPLRQLDNETKPALKKLIYAKYGEYYKKTDKTFSEF